MSKVKVLHLIKSLGRGGAETLLPQTLKLHNQSIYEFHYIYFLPWKDQMVAELEQNNGIVTCLPAKNNIQLLAQAKAIKKYCEVNKINLIHCHLPWAGFAGRLVHMMSGIPLIYSEHNMQERYHPLTKFLNSISYNKQSLVLGVSEDVTKSIQKNISPKIKVSTLLNGVNTETFRRQDHDVVRNEYKIPNDAIVIGIVAVFRFQKRIEEWLEVFKTTSKSNSKIYGIIVGAGPLEKSIQQKCTELGLNDKIIFPGLQTNVKPFYEAMDIFMMCSSFEGLPIALLEAMSMECAIVSTDAGGIKEVIRDGVDGKLVPVDQFEKLSNHLLEIINEPSLLRDFKKAARARVVSKFSLKTMVSELELNYKHLTEVR